MRDQLSRLRELGWRMTPQRRAVVVSLRQTERAQLTAEEVFRRARSLVPEISLATVYNSLRELVELGEVVSLAIGPGATRYEFVDRARHHLTCIACGEVLDVEVGGVDGLQLEDDHGYALSAISIVFRGRCGTCPPLR